MGPTNHRAALDLTQDGRGSFCSAGAASHNGGGGEEVGVVAALLQVHDDVEQRHLVSSSFGVEGLEVFRQDELVVLPARHIEKTLEDSAAKTPKPCGVPPRSRFRLAHFCMGLSSTRTMSSVLEGMCLKTSAFSLLSMCGPSMSCSFLIWSSLAMSANSSRKISSLLHRVQGEMKDR